MSKHADLYKNYTTTSTHFAEGSDQIFDAYRYLVNQYILPHIPSKNHSPRILDIGCGWGGILKVLSKKGYKSLEGFDLSEEQVKKAKSLGLDNVVVGDAVTNLKKKKKAYDVILLIDVVEHFPIDEAVELIRLARKALTDDGILIIQVPNGASLISLNYYNDLTHYKAYAVNSLNQLARMAGFEGDLSYQEVRPYLTGSKNMISNVLWKLVVKPLTRIYMLAVVGNSAGKIYTPNIMGYWKKKK